MQIVRFKDGRYGARKYCDITFQYLYATTTTGEAVNLSKRLSHGFDSIDEAIEALEYIVSGVDSGETVSIEDMGDHKKRFSDIILNELPKTRGYNHGGANKQGQEETG